MKFIFIIPVVIAILVSGCDNSTAEQSRKIVEFNNYSKPIKLPQYKLPVENADYAMSYGLMKMRENISHVEKQGRVNWRVTAEYNKDETPTSWSVKIKTTGAVIPSYFCETTFTPDGKDVSNEMHSNECGYNK